MSKLLVVAMFCIVRVAHADALDDPKDPRIALGLSIGGTAASLALTAGALATGHDKLAIAGGLSTLVTPSFGQWYAGKPFTVGMGLRVAGSALFLAAGESTLRCLHIDFDMGPSCDASSAIVLPLLLFGGWIGYAAGAALDITRAPRAAREYNVAHQLHVAPVYMHTPSGTPAMGLGLGGIF